MVESPVEEDAVDEEESALVSATGVVEGFCAVVTVVLVLVAVVVVVGPNKPELVRMGTGWGLQRRRLARTGSIRENSSSEIVCWGL